MYPTYLYLHAHPTDLHLHTNPYLPIHTYTLTNPHLHLYLPTYTYTYPNLPGCHSLPSHEVWNCDKVVTQPPYLECGKSNSLTLHLTLVHGRLKLHYLL